MTPSQYGRVVEAFAAAIAAPAEGREEAARRACGDDPAVLAEVLAMLAVDQRRLNEIDSAGGVVGARLMQAVGGERGPTESDEDDAPARKLSIGTRLGAYTLVRQLGEGGMGVVYLARQDSPSREVALKVMRPGAWSPQHLQRFRREATVLARLHHPGIAQIYEAGVAYLAGAAGEELPQPYFAFEHINGARLDEHVRRAAAGARGILELLALIADAVHDAHEHGVVHRDLKPSNILVDRSGQPKVLDFGVARAESEPGAEQTIVTAAGQIVGTLPYMSPEQVGAEHAEVDRRADVYALGVIAYELLTGRLPLEVSQRSMAEAARLIKEQEPTRLSSLDARLRGDVETIVGKALEKDRDRRYATAAALAADIRRFMRDEPIDARPPSTLYQLSKFAKRNRGLVGGVATAFVVLLASTVGLWFLYRDAVDARLAAETATGRATAALEESTRQRDKAEASRAEAARSAEVAERTAELYRQVFEGLDPNVSSGRDTSLLKEMLDRSAVRIARDQQIEPAVAGVVLGALGVAYQNIARLPDADVYLTSAYEKLRDALGERDPKTLSAMNALAVLRRARGRVDEAEPLYARAYRLRREVLGPEHADTQRSQNNLAVLYWSTGRSRLAHPLLKDLLAVRERTLGENDRMTLQTLGNLANITMDLGGRRREAVEMLKAAYERTLAVQGPEHLSTMQRLNNYAIALSRSGRSGEAAVHLEHVLEVYTKALEPNHPSLLRSMLNLAEAYQKLERLPEAEALCVAAMEGRCRTLGAFHADTLFTMGQLVDVWIAQGRLDDARSLLDAIFPAVLAQPSEETSDRFVVYKRLAQIASINRDVGAEIAWREAALESMDAAYDANHANRLGGAEELADAYLRGGRAGDAERVLVGVISGADEAWLANDPQLVDLFAMLATALSRQGEGEMAERIYTAAWAMAGAAGDGYFAGHTLRLTATALADHLERVGRCEEAELWRGRAPGEPGER